MSIQQFSRGLLLGFLLFPLTVEGQIRVLARTGDSLPGTPGTISNFENPVLRRSGEPVLAARLTPPAGTSKSVLLRVGPARGLGRVIVAAGDPSPDANGNFSALFDAFTSASGAVGFRQSLNNALSNPAALFVGANAQTNLVIAARQGQSLPEGGVLSNINSVRGFTDLDQIVFEGQASPFASGYWLASASSGIQRIVSTTSAAPGGGQFFGFPDLSLNQSVTAAFTGYFTDGFGLFRKGASTSVTAIALSSMAVPGGNGEYLNFDLPRINDSGNIAVLARFQATSGGNADNVGILLHSGSTNIIAVRRGTFVPDGNGRFSLDPSGRMLLFNNNDEILFRSGVSGASGGSDDGMFLYRPSGTIQLARKNGPAPGGGTYTTLFDVVGLNNNGVTVFSARFRATPQSTEQFGLFAYKNGVVSMIIAVGDTVPNFGQVTALGYAVDEGLGASPLNDLDQMVFNFSSSPASQHVAVWGLAPTPAPEISLEYNGVAIANGDNTPSATDGTLFPELNAANGFLERTFTIRNQGSANLDLAGSPRVSVTGTNAADFLVTQQPASPVAAGAVANFVVRFDPSGSGSRTASVSITNNDEDENPFAFALAGSGTSGGPEIEIRGNGAIIANGSNQPTAANNTDFGPCILGGSPCSRVYEIRNIGTAQLALTGSPRVALSGPQSGDFSVTAFPGPSIPNGGTDSFIVQFSPGALGLRTATVSISNTDADENPAFFQIQGAGEVNTPVPRPDIQVRGNGMVIANGSQTTSESNFTEFGSVLTRVFTIHNIGNAALQFPISPSVAIVPVGRVSCFSIQAQPSGPIAPGASSSFTVVYRFGRCDAVGDVVVYSDDPDQPQTRFRVTAGAIMLVDGFEDN